MVLRNLANNDIYSQQKFQTFYIYVYWSALHAPNILIFSVVVKIELMLLVNNSTILGTSLYEDF